MNGAPGVFFNGTNMYMALDSIAPKIRTAETLTVVFASHAKRKVGPDLLPDGKKNNMRQFFFSMHQQERTLDVLRFGFDKGRQYRFRSRIEDRQRFRGPNMLQPTIFSVVVNAREVHFFHNGARFHTHFLVSKVPFDQVTYISLGQEWDGLPSDLFHGSFGDFLLFDRALSDVERRLVEGTLSTKYQIPVTGPDPAVPPRIGGF